ncbi:MAG: histidinol-phosphatase [Deltaproteobacteria bacterium]|nr:histidinol-phosphatase [Deltaproteobacteria bacterium]
MIDYHVHTRLCNHAEGIMPDYILKAIEIGLEEICFLDHLTLQDQGKGLSMTPGEVPFYFQAVQMLKKKYAVQIDVKAGLEIDFSEAHVDMAADIAGTYAFDVIGSSVHFPDGVDIVRRRSAWRNEDNYKDIDIDRVYGQYYETLARMLDYSYFDIICHFDLVKKFGRKPSRSFDEKIIEILKKVKQKNLTIELNTSGYHHAAEESYPAPDIIKKCKDFGISFALGSDAHNPQSVGRYFDKAFQLLQEAGYKEIAVFNKRKKSVISIDYSKAVR